MAHLITIQAQQADLLRAVHGNTERLTAVETKLDVLDGKLATLDGKLEDVKKDTSASFKMLFTLFGGVQIFFGLEDKNPIEQARLFGTVLTQLLNFLKP